MLTNVPGNALRYPPYISMKFTPSYSPRSRVLFILSLSVAPFTGSLYAQLIGSAGNYGVLGASTVTSTGNTVIEGGLGLYPGTSITGFDGVGSGGPGQFTGILSLTDTAALNAQADALAAFIHLASLTFTQDLTGQDLGGLTLTPGVYFFATSAQLTGALTLDAQNDPNARFVFQIGSTLTTASASEILFSNLDLASDAGADAGVYWQVGSSATLGTGTDFAGNILAQTSVTLNTSASIDHGRAIALNGAVTLDDNYINASDISGGFGAPQPTNHTPVPEPATFGVFGAVALLASSGLRRRRRVVSAK